MISLLCFDFNEISFIFKMGKVIKPKLPSSLHKSKDKMKLVKDSKRDGKQTSSKKKGSIALKVAKPTFKKIISKKDKQHKKKLKLKEKLELTKAAFKEDKNKKKREKTAIVGDLKPLLDSLPSLDELLTIRASSKRTGIAAIDKMSKEPKTRTGRKNKLLHQKTEKMFDRFDHVQRVWKDPEFQKNPRKLIAEQIRARRLANEMETH